MGKIIAFAMILFCSVAYAQEEMQTQAIYGTDLYILDVHHVTGMSPAYIHDGYKYRRGELDQYVGWPAQYNYPNMDLYVGTTSILAIYFNNDGLSTVAMILPIDPF